MDFDMTPEQLFSYAGTAALAGWVILVFLPRRVSLLLYIPRYCIPFALSLLYAGQALTSYFVTDGGFDSLGNVRTLFLDDHMLLAGWIHYLAFDLFIGGWIAVKADAIGLSRLVQAPILLATFMFGPVGLALFLVMRAALNNKEDVRHA